MELNITLFALKAS